MRPCLQMIVHVPFSQNVRIKSVILKIGKVPSLPCPCGFPPITHDAISPLFMSPICFHTAPPSSDRLVIPFDGIGRGETTPRHFKIFANYATIIDFADVANTKPHLDISLSEGETVAVEYPVRVAAFTSVHALSLYFVSRILLRSCNASPCSASSFEITIYGAEVHESLGRFGWRRCVESVLCRVQG